MRSQVQVENPGIEPDQKSAMQAATKSQKQSGSRFNSPLAHLQALGSTRMQQAIPVPGCQGPHVRHMW